jgi:hypothetical protein
LDNYENETTWKLRDPSGSVIGSGGTYADADEIIDVDITSSAKGTFRFTIYDSYGDGLSETGSSNSNSTASFKISVEGVTQYQSTNLPNFQDSSAHTFDIIADNDGDGIADADDIDDDNDGIPDYIDLGVTCTSTVVYSGATGGKIYEIDLSTGTSTLETTSPHTTGYINALASNPDDEVVYYGVETEIYVYDPSAGTHTMIKDITGLVTGGNLESGGGAYYNGFYYIGPEDASGNSTGIYKLAVSNNGMTLGNPVSLGNPAGATAQYGDFVISSEQTDGVIYGSVSSAQLWKYDIGSSTYSVINNSGTIYQTAIALDGQLWAATGTTLRKMDQNGNVTGTTITLPELCSDLTGPFNCVQADYTEDLDNDGIPNHQDQDSDGDGIPDNVEAQETGSYIAPTGTDTDNDGLDNAYDTDNGGTALNPVDTDGDNTPDYHDLDSDNEGGNDQTEANLTLSGSDSDNDGLDNNIDQTTGYTDPNGSINDPTTLPDDDNDQGTGGDVDFRDAVDDSALDSDGDGIPNDSDLDNDNDGIPDQEENTCQTAQFINGDFEDALVSINTYVITSENNIPGWETTATDDQIEIWKSGFNGVPAYSGNYFAEIDANMRAKLFQTLTVAPGDIVTWKVAHRGRSGTDVMHIMVGPTGSPTNQQTASTGTSAWQVYTANYTVPAGITEIEIGFEAVSSVGGVSYGNFIDDVELYIISSNSCDSDNDGIPNYLDIDSDNDGITDVIEAGGSDPDGDGRIGTGNITDTDGDGLSNIVDSDNGGSALSNPDTDGDGMHDIHDLDSDDDGILDIIEGQTTAGYSAPSGNDTDNDGLDDQFDGNNGGSYIIPVNTDGDANPDYLDTDSDDDGQSDFVEAYDTDNDAVANTDKTHLDNDLDGLDNAFDSDGTSTSNNGGPNNSNQVPSNFPNLDGGNSEKDWREDNPDGGSGSLPIELVSFDAQIVDQEVLLSWTTAVEINNAYFLIERSADGSSFEAIGSVNGAGNSVQLIDYSYVDQNPLSGISYYRLRQVDYDGSNEVSEARIIEFAAANQLAISKVYPNPTDGMISIRVQNSTTELVQVQLFNMQGQLIKQSSLSNDQTEANLNLLEGVSSGVYYIRLSTSQYQSQMHKVIKR